MPGPSNRRNHRRKPQKPLKFDTTRTVATCKSIAGNLKPGFLSRTSCDSTYSTLFSQEDLKRQLGEHNSLLDEAREERNKAEDLCSSRLREIQDMELQIKKRTVAFIASHTKLQAERQAHFHHNIAEYVCLNDEKDALNQALATPDITAKQLKDVIRIHLGMLQAITNRHRPVQGSYMKTR